MVGKAACCRQKSSIIVKYFPDGDAYGLNSILYLVNSTSNGGSSRMNDRWCNGLAISWRWLSYELTKRFSLLCFESFSILISREFQIKRLCHLPLRGLEAPTIEASIAIKLLPSRIGATLRTAIKVLFPNEFRKVTTTFRKVKSSWFVRRIYFWIDYTRVKF